MTHKEKQFEEQLNSLVLLKALLMKENEFDETTQQAYQEAWEHTFDLLKVNDAKDDKVNYNGIIV